MRSSAAAFDDIKAEIDEIPVVDTHEHQIAREKSTDILSFLISGYITSDFASALGDQEAAKISDTSLSLEERWPVFARGWEACRLTGYGRALRYGVKQVFGSDEITLQSVKEWQNRLPDFSQEEPFEAMMQAAKVAARISDKWPSLTDVVEQRVDMLPNQFETISLPQFHNLTRSEMIFRVGSASGKAITSIDEYVDACAHIFERWLGNRAVCFKDQSAYDRSIAYGMPTHHEAELQFNTLLANPRASLEWSDDGNALSDYLMHRFMRIARQMNLPVQLHTGHMAGIRNDVSKANAAGLRSLLEVHRDVRFDLFHANWPYGGDILFLVKNYPNACLNFCWAHQIDPLYAKELLKQAVATIPVTKIFGVGSDVGGGHPHMTASHVQLAREVIAAALAELVETHYIDRSDASELATLWLYENARNFFALPIPALGANARQ